MKPVRKAVIPAAGLGTRFLPATKAMPKEMLTIVDKPTLQYIVEEIVASGITEVLIVTGRNKKAIEDHFDRAVELELLLEKTGKMNFLKIVQDITDLAQIYYVRQKETKGLGHAILQAKAFVGDEPFAVLNGDDVIFNDKEPCTLQLIRAYEKCGTSVLGVQTVENSQICKYGAVKTSYQDGRLYRVEDFVEKPACDKAPSNLASLGRYIIMPEIFEYLETQQPGAGGEIQLTDAMNRMGKDFGLHAYDFAGRRYDIGDKLGYLQATCEYALRDESLKEEFKRYLSSLSKQF